MHLTIQHKWVKRLHMTLGCDVQNIVEYEKYPCPQEMKQKPF